MLNTSRNTPVTPSIIVSEIGMKESDADFSPDCIRKTRHPNLSTSPASYDESLRFLSHSLEQICGRGSTSSLTNLLTKGGSPKSPNVSARPQSFQLNSLKGSLPQINYIKKDSDGTVLLKIRHDETHEKLKQNLSKICSPPGPSPVGVSKRISDAQENLRFKFRVKIAVDNDVVNLNNLFITVDQQRTLTVSYFEEAENSDGARTSKDLHSCKVPECISLEKILCSFQEGPSLYLRQSSGSSVEFGNTAVRHVPVIHTDEDSQTFAITLKLPAEVSLETVEVRRIDERLAVRAFGFRLGDSHGRISQLESSLGFQIELPEESDGRKLTAKVFPNRILMFEGKLLPTSRRMTCKF